ncbi:MAG: site-2 protease family protein [Acidimicrobiales bacterium]|nr:site-2 protease family protein [Acidimicrobiales bacterium]
MNGLTIARIHGIAVRVNWGVMFIALGIAWTLAEDILPGSASGHDTAAYRLWALLVTILFFAGLVAHEFGHSLVAQREGVEVSSITLWIFGGVASLDSPVPSASSAFRIAIAGPAVSFGLGAGFVAAGSAIDGVARAALLWLGFINIALAVFNLVPAFPLDGGRVYQAYMWHRTGSEVAATVAAAKLGRALAFALVAAGLAEMIFLGAIGGLWLVVLGWFISEAAASEVEYVRHGRPLADVAVSRLMTPAPATVRSSWSLEQLADALLSGPRHAAYPVVDDNGLLVGTVEASELHRVPRSEWPTTALASVAKPPEQSIVVSPDTSVLDLLRDFERHRGHRAVVVSDLRPVGMVAPSDVVRFVAVMDASESSR